MASLDELFFLLLGTCGLFGNALLVATYVRAGSSLAPNYLQITRVLLFVAIHEFSFSLFLLDQGLLAIASLAAGCALQFIALKVSRHPETLSAHVLSTHFANNEGTHVCGKWMALVVFVAAFLLLATPLRDLSVWFKLLFTVPTPISAYFAIALLTTPRTGAIRNGRAPTK